MTISTDRVILVERTLEAAFGALVAPKIARALLESATGFVNVSFEVRMSAGGDFINLNFIQVEQS